MVQLIIEESGFPKNRETLHEMQESWKVPIDELLARLPGKRILSGFEVTQDIGPTTTITAGILLYNGKLWSVEAYEGPSVDSGDISFFETTISGEFNIGTQANPIYDMRPWKIVRTAKVGDHPGALVKIPRHTFLRGRKQLEYLKAGSIYIGPVVMSVATAIYHVDFQGSIGTKDYQVLGNFRSADPNNSFSRAFVWDINNRTNFGFDVFIDQATANSIPLMFDYTVIPINRTQYFSQG